MARFVCDDKSVTAMKEYASLFFNLSHDALATLTIEGELLVYNLRWSSILGWSDDELRSRELKSLAHVEDQLRVELELRRLSHGLHDSTADFNVRLQKSTGGFCWFHLYILFRQSDEVYLVVGRDITKEVHEVKGPWLALNSVLPAQKFLDRVGSGARLVLASIKQGVESVRSPLEYFALRPLVDQAVAQVMKRLAMRGIELRMSFNGTASKAGLLTSHPEKIVAVFAALLENAGDGVEGMDSPWIEIQVFEENENVVLWITDAAPFRGKTKGMLQPLVLRAIQEVCKEQAGRFEQERVEDRASDEPEGTNRFVLTLKNVGAKAKVA